jgi:hypothetical protein
MRAPVLAGHSETTVPTSGWPTRTIRQGWSRRLRPVAFVFLAARGDTIAASELALVRQFRGGGLCVQLLGGSLHV